MDTYLAGLAGLKEMPDYLFVPAVQREKTAMTEAASMNVPVIGVCDTNANIKYVKYVIPANDDAVKSIEMIVTLVAEAIKAGNKEFEKTKSLAEKAQPSTAKKMEKAFGDKQEETMA